MNDRKKQRLLKIMFVFAAVAAVFVSLLVNKYMRKERLQNRMNEKTAVGEIIWNEESLEETDSEEKDSEDVLSREERLEKGYNLPINKEDKQNAQEDCLRMMNQIYEIYLTCDKGKDSNVTIEKETVLLMLDTLAKDGEPVACYDNQSNMRNYDKMEAFLVQSLSGQSGNIVCYELHSGGTLGRNEFIYDGKDMYLLYTNAVWNEQMKPMVSTTTYTRINSWNYSEKGWFYYELCVPEPPEVTEVVDGNCMLRVRPMKEEYREFADTYLCPIGYQGNNLFSSNWDVENLEQLDYIGLYESLYNIEYQELFNGESCKEGIKKENFEKLIEKYLPVTEKQLQKYAAYDKEKQLYPWDRLTCMNYSPTMFGTAVPEITDIKKNKDGTMSVYVDAVCEAEGTDRYISHILTVKLQEDGGITYLSNRIEKKDMAKIPAYQYRLK